MFLPYITYDAIRKYFIGGSTVLVDIISNREWWGGVIITFLLRVKGSNIIRTLGHYPTII